MNIKLIVTDLDNTLLRRDKTVSDYTVSIFERLRERGFLLAFATGRSEFASQRFVKRMAPDIVVSNGGALARTGEKILLSEPILSDTANAVIAACLASNNIRQITVEATNGYFDTQPIDPTVSGWEDYANAQCVDFSQPIDYGEIFKITVLANDFSAINAIMQTQSDLSVLKFAGEDWYQIKGRGVTKAKALARAAEHLGMDIAEAAAFGDDTNDLEMLCECGVGIAVANAIGELKAVADCICGDCDEDGVARWLEGNVL